MREMPMTQYLHLPIINRIVAGILGSYAFTWGFCALGMAGLAALGVSFHTAETGVMLVAFLLFLCLFLWTFAAQSMVKVWAVLAGGALLMTGVSLLLQRSLVG
jgi:hypothetical protein